MNSNPAQTRPPRPIHGPIPGRAVPTATCNHVFGACLLAIMVFLVWRSPSTRIFDERYHLDRSDQLAHGRPMREVFTEPTPSAVGPVYPLCMWAVQSLFGTDARWARAATLAAMLVCLALTAQALKRSGQEPSWYILLFAVAPFVVSSMIALTEMWALVPTLAAFVILWRPKSGRHDVYYSFASGVCFAIAVLTRQSTVILLPALMIALIKQRGYRPLEILVLGFPPAAALLLLLALWGGLIPPGQEHLMGPQSFSYANFVKGAVYCALMGILMNPRLLLRRMMLLAMAVALAGNLLTDAVSYRILLSVFPDHGRYTALFRQLFWGLGCGFTAGFFIIYAWELRKKLGSPIADCLLVVCLACLSCGLITDSFSSRYLVLATPFLALMVSSSPSLRTPNYVMRICVVFGFLLGLNSFIHYK